MWYISDAVKNHFSDRLEQAIDLIKQSGIQYIEFGIFGSYARQEYKATSDIDICIIVNDHPDNTVSGLLRTDAEEIKVDIVYVTPSTFKNSDSLFIKNLRRDYRRICLYE